MPNPANGDAADATAVPAKSSDANISARDDRGLPAQLVNLAVLVGLAFAAAGLALLYFESNPIASSLTLCVGLGIVLAAFGARAGGAWKGWSATGAGAMAIGLFLVLMTYTPDTPSAFSKRGQLRGDLSKVADLRIIDEDPWYQFRDRNSTSIRFIVLDRSLRSERIRIQVDTTEKGEGREFFEMTGSAKAIAERYLAGAKKAGADTIIQWKFDYQRRIISDAAGKVIFRELEELDETDLKPRVHGWNADPWRRLPTLVGTAFAAAADAAPKLDEVSALLQELNSEDATARRNARDALAVVGPAAVPAMMEALRGAPDSYRVRLGVVYALSEMLRRDAGQNTLVSARLTDADIADLVGAASHSDKTMRYHATQLLYSLKDPRAVKPSLDAVRAAKDPNGVYNNVLILKGTAQQLPPDEKSRIQQEVSSSVKADSERTQELIKQRW